MLSWRGIGCPDDPLSPFPLADRPREARLLDEALCLGLGDGEAWAWIVGDAATKVVVDSKGREKVVLAGPLAIHATIYGNRPKRPRRTGQKPRRASQPVESVPDVPRPRRGREIEAQGRLL